MAIRKSKHISNYTVIPNEIFNSGLSIEAIGLLSYFLSLPHDWVIYKTTLHTSLNIGRDKLDKIFKELTDNKYIKSTKSNNNGKITYEHIVYDKPFTEIPLTVNPSTEKPFTEKPSTAKQHLQSTNKQSTDIINKNIESKHYTFDLFWELYDKKVGDKNKIASKYNKLSTEDKQAIFLHVPKYIQSQPDKQYRKNPETYLNNKSWLDEIILPNSQSKKNTKGTINDNYF